MAGLARGAPLVGLIAKAGAGKDTVASILVTRHNYVRIAFADALRAVLRATDPYIDSPGVRLSQVLAPHGWERAKQLPEVRRLLQDLGVAVREHIGEDTWVDVAMRQVDAIPDVPVVITDVRFPNEVKAIVDRGGYLVRIERPDAPGLGSRSLHVSETALDAYNPHYRLSNTGTLEHLYERADLLAAWVKRAFDRGAFAWQRTAETWAREVADGEA